MDLMMKEAVVLKSMMVICIIFLSIRHASANDIISKAEISSDFSNAVKNIGGNCMSPQNGSQNYAEFIDEIYNAIKALMVSLGSKSVLLSMKPDYPTVCHVYTQPQIETYKESIFVTKKNVKGSLIKTESPIPTYMYPKYFIEVTEKGNDPHHAFAKNNAQYKLNRKIAKKLMKQVDRSGMSNIIKGIFIAVLGGNVDKATMSLLSSFLPFESMRVTTSKGNNTPTFEATAWPVGLSRTIARELTVCGKPLDDMGKDPGGYGHDMPGLPMLCPVSSSTDMYSYWDSGVLDYINPNTYKTILNSTIGTSCMKNAWSNTAEDVLGYSTDSIGSGQDQEAEMSNYPTMRDAMMGCSYPILGDSEAIMSTYLKNGKNHKWSKYSCTAWGKLLPRMSSQTGKNDFSYVNAALRFKLLSNEIMGLKVGKSEKWSLAYPWGKRGYGLFSVGSPVLTDITSSKKHLSNRLKSLINDHKNGLLVETGAIGVANELKKISDRSSGSTLSINGDRRIYTIFEKIQCNYPVTKTTVAEGTPMESVYYNDCKSAFRLEAYKLIQTKYLRRICDSMGELVGKPWR